MNTEARNTDLKNQATDLGITLTPRALIYIQEKLKNTRDAVGFRFGLKPAGCSGYSYKVEIATSIEEETDTIFETERLKIIVDNGSLKYLRGTVIDCVQEGLNEFLKFRNPNVKGECGCGESFTIEE